MTLLINQYEFLRYTSPLKGDLGVFVTKVGLKLAA